MKRLPAEFVGKKGNRYPDPGYIWAPSIIISAPITVPLKELRVKWNGGQWEPDVIQAKIGKRVVDVNIRNFF